MIKPEPSEPTQPTEASEVPAQDAGHQALARFHAHLLATKPRATIWLVAVLCGVFVLQLIVGGGDSTGTYELMQLGALSPARVLAGEWWRVVGWSFLHIGFLHFVMNVYVLFVIGGALERVVGSWRFLTMYTAAVLLGAVVVMTTSAAQLTAGASGGIFGLLGAEAVLVLSPRSPLPLAMRMQRRSAVLMNLAINVFYSFRPNVSFAGHAGGFLAGALVALFIPATLDGLISGAMRAPTRLLGMASVGVLALGLVASVAPALPALLSTEPLPLTVQALPGMDLRAGFPAELGAPVAVEPNAVRAGSLATDRGVVALVYVPNDAPTSAAEMDAELSALLVQYQSPEARAELVPEQMVFADASLVQVEGRPVLLVHFRTASSELVQTTVYRPLDDGFVRVDVAHWARFSTVFSDLAERVAASVE